MPTLDDLKQAEKEAQYYLDQWNLFIERACERTGFVDPWERKKALDAWMNAENKAGELRRQLRSQ